LRDPTEAMISLLRSFLHPLRGLALLFSPGLRKYVVIPLLVNILIFSLTAWIGGYYFDRFIAWALPAESWLHYLEWLLWPLFVVAYLLVAFYSFTIVANLIASPFNGILAARVEEKITGRLPEESPLHFVKLAIPVLILMAIPGVNAIGSALWIVLGFWFLTIEYIDYPMGNHQIRPREQRRRLRKHPFHSWAFGAGANLLMAIPVLNFAAMPATVAGATRLWLEIYSKES